MTFEERVAQAAGEKLADGTIERLVKEYIEGAVREALEDSFGDGGKGKRLIQEKLDSILEPAIEAHDFNRYIVKLDDVLTGIIKDTCLPDYGKILTNFKRLMKVTGKKEITLSEIFKEYCRYAAKNAEIFSADGERMHIRMEVRDRGGYFSHRQLDIDFTCQSDHYLNTTLCLWKDSEREAYYIATPGMDDLNFRTLSRADEFWMFLATLRRDYAMVLVDSMQLSADVRSCHEF